MIRLAATLCVLSLSAAPALAQARAGTPPAPQPAQPPIKPHRLVPRALTLPGVTAGEWSGCYLDGKKIGWAYSELRAETRADDQLIVVSREDAVMEVGFGDTKMRREISVERYYQHIDNGKLLGFKVVTKGDGGDEVLTGTSTERGITAVRKRPGRADETVVFPPSKETLESAVGDRLAAFSGEKFEGAMFNLEQTFADEKIAAERVGKEERMIAGIKVPVFTVRLMRETLAAPMTGLIARDGRRLETRVGPLVIRNEPKAVAQQLDRVDRLEILAAGRVPLAQPIPRQEIDAPSVATFLLSGVPRELVRSTPRQAMKPSKGEPHKTLATVTAKGPEGKLRLPITPKSPEVIDALKPTPAIESADPAIQSTARRVIGETRDAWTAAKALNEYVFKTLEKTYGLSNDRATDVLAAGKGDCTEHALLFTALARSVGLPARRVNGVVYFEGAGGPPALYWHEWVEVWIGGWVSMDPALGQSVADASHLAFGGEGNGNSVAVMSVLKAEYLPAK